MARSRTHTRVVGAVNFLVAAPNHNALIHELTRVVERWDERPAVYGGQLSCLNAMIDVGLSSRHAFEKLVELIDRTRRAVPRARRGDYQRDLMRERRARMATAMALHEARYGPLTPAARAAEAHGITERWNAAKRRFLAERGEMSWAESNAATREFWRKLDARLACNYAAATRTAVRNAQPSMEHPAHG